MTDLDVRRVGADAAGEVLAVITAAFAARPPLDPPAPALAETLESVGAALTRSGGLLATANGSPVGALLFDPQGDLLGLRRFGVLPDQQGTGVAAALVAEATEVGVERGVEGLAVVARPELPETIRFWERQGFVEVGRDAPHVELVHRLAWSYDVPEAEDARELGAALAPLLRAGDLIILSGDLGAGKTTFTQGLGRGLRVRGDITSPTFVIARLHPSLVGGPALVHADAYRLGGLAELDDLDLDASLDEAVTVVEWGEGVAEGLAEDRLEIRIVRAVGAEADPEDDARRIDVLPVGRRWLGVRRPSVVRAATDA